MAASDGERLSGHEQGSRGAAAYDVRLAAMEGEYPYTGPWDAPLAGSFPIRCEQVTFLTACYRTDVAAIERVLPPPLEASSDVVLVHVYEIGSADYAGENVRECNIMVGARLRGGDTDVTGGYSPYFLVNSDAALAAGREVHGQPKKMADVVLEARGDLLVGEVSRNGIAVVTATLPYKHGRADPAAIRQHFDFAMNLNLKLIPHIDGTPAVRQLTSRRLSDLVVHDCWSGPSTVELRPNAQVPVWLLPVCEPLEGYLWSADFTLVPGEVVHDYLAGDGGSPGTS